MTSPETDKMTPSDERTSAGRFARGQAIAGRFTVVRYIARGGMGEVYEVEDRFLQHVHVALKVILPEIAGDTTSSYRFEQEVLLARKVVHPNLCPIYDLARCDDPAPPFLFLTMKLLPGEPLSARLRRPGLIPRDQAIAMFRQLVAGLAAIHDAGVIHRDIKPNNVMLDSSLPELCVSIMDFGLARSHDAEATMATQSLMAGTPGYMAPEILRGAGPSRAGDIFALGVLLHQVLTGEHPKVKPLSLSIEPTPKLDKADVPAIFIHAVKEFLSIEPERRCAQFEHVKGTLSIGASGTYRAAEQGFSRSGMKSLSRRQFVIGSAFAAGAAAGGLVWKRDRLYDLMHPLPAKRFVALVGWPAPADPRLEASIRAVVDAIGSELARAEAFDHNLFIIPHHIGADVASMAQMNGVRESLGANLVFSASADLAGEELRLLLRVFDPAPAKVLRETILKVRIDEQLSLPDRAVAAAARLLNVNKIEVSEERIKLGTTNPEAYAALQRAEGLRNQENDAGLDAAIEVYKQAVEIDPHYALALAKLALAYFRSYILHRDIGTLVAAQTNCDSALQENPRLVEAHLAKASVLDWTGDKPGALKELATALSIDPGNPAALLRQAQELTRCNLWRDAEQTFARLQTARPNSWLAYEELGIVYSYQGEYAKAEKEFHAASVAAPKQTLPLVNLSAIALQTGNLDDALTYAEKSLAVAPNDHGYAARAAALRAKGKFEEALSDASKAVALAPNEADNWMELGDTYAAIRGRLPEMKKSFDKAAKLQDKIVHTDPTEGPTWMSLALAQAKTGDLDKSSSSLRTADHNFAGDIDSQLLKVRILELLHRHDEALTIASACLGRGATPFQFQIMPDIDSLRNDSKFQGLLRNSSANT